MRKRRPTRFTAASAVLGAGLLTVTGCGLQSSSGYTPAFEQGSIEEIDGAESTTVRVVSKNFSEQLILGKIMVLAAEAAGFDTRDMTNVPGSQPARRMMLNHEADISIEYTGTAWLTYMGHEEGIPDSQEQWQAVHDEDLENGLVWGAPGPFNNTYAFAVRHDYAEEHNLTRLSDIHNLPEEERTFCVESEFNSRADGMTPMLEHYGLDRGSEVPDGNIGMYDTGSIYNATAEGACNFGEVFTTDGRILALNLTVLEDDEQYFPAYNGSPVFNEELLDEYPELEEAIAPIIARLDNETLQRLNAKVDVDGEEPADVAFEWMVEEGFISEPN
ncbi:glycine betaine ABC transporter substrate-binding protein [Kocuria coralli]|uniref:Glycine betaine ABC transporter substrate-binding protein n=1 Tax=Kocuria coralli TaxID=1461025 RepID=A0A5J5KXU5_9MICC|nr:glycine betaine ABC transporter substrate-binding protein [Kocuria coralli]KAA9394120.1 glycine betaine ABC transporter substrate-binding protein [Kocuria coralli]